MKRIVLFFVCGVIMGHASMAQTDTTLLQKKFSYILPNSWSVQDRFIDGWADMVSPEPPILVLDYILYDASDAASMKAYIELNLKAIQETDYPDAKIVYKEKRSIHSVEFNIVHVSYTREGKPWMDYQYLTPRQCGSICKGYLFSIQAPADKFPSLAAAINQFEVGLKVE